jgi:mono/diheme cytochrome c family protein
MPRWTTILATCIFGYGVCLAADARAEDDSALARDAYAILNRSCFECHGPARQDGGLRLDSGQAVFRGGDSGVAFDVKEPDSGELMRRIRLPKGHAEVMPKRGDVLSENDVARLRHWIARGAPWSDDAASQKHWAYVAPVKSYASAIAETSNKNPIDFFVQKQWESHAMTASPTADLRTLVRRLYFDTIGLPPSPTDVEAFVHAATNNLQEAVELWVDRLLASPQFGEKWARAWLDAARYADSHGFQRDDLHEIWAYRDWVIRALNDDMPFDQFTIEQLAGDLLPDPTQDQLIATGFNRCAPCNVEAGTDPLENRFNQVVDRVNTLGYVWLGATLECAQCHDHKYDPFRQRDYFGLFAFFNQTELEADRSNPKVPGSIRFVGPYLQLSNKEEEQKRNELDLKIEQVKAQLETAIQDSLSKDSSTAPTASQVAFSPSSFESIGGASYELLADKSILLRDDPPEVDTYIVTVELGKEPIVGFLLETLTDPSLPGTGPGRGDAARPNYVLNGFEVQIVNGVDESAFIPVSLTDARADFSQKNFDVSNAIDRDLKSAWAISPQFKRPHWAAFRVVNPEMLRGAKQLRFRLVQTFGDARTIGRFRLSALIGDYEAALPMSRKESLAVATLQKKLDNLQRERDRREIPKTLVMRELSEPRMSTMYNRGDFRSPAEPVEPSTPAVLHAYDQAGPRNRLSLARWLVSRNNPLVGRVTINRLWSEIFGAGLVGTPEDFGLKGDAPSHPELLDWLAVDFMDNGWSQKKAIRQILLSETYRQSSRFSVGLLDRDPLNRQLARGPRFRLTAESIRDNALAIAGRLSLKQFGPPIRPPQPDGLWKKVGGQQYDYTVSPGDEQYRRSVYVVLKRMSPYPSFINFDATARLACRVNRGRSNTPLQALNLLNDPVYVDAAKGLAARVQHERPTDNLDEQLEHAFRIAVARRPSPEELDALRRLYVSEKDAGASTDNESKEAAWFAVASALLNLDETITKE